MKLNSFAVRRTRKSYYGVDIETGKSHGNNVKYSLLRMTKTKVRVSYHALSSHDRHYALCSNAFTPGKIAEKDEMLA